MARLALFTDLDGTLIDFRTYGFERTAERARNFVAEGHVLVFCSSKTAVEQRALMVDMGLSVPAIVENGGGIYLPPDSSLFAENSQANTHEDGSRLIPLGPDVQRIRSFLNNLEGEMAIHLGMYQDLTDQALVALTGLSVDAAGRARQRAFSETLTADLPEETWDQLRGQLQKVGLQCLCGGRFHTVTGALSSKGTALKKVFRELADKAGGSWRSAAVGDSANDASMLAVADLPYLVQKHDGQWADIDQSTLERIPEIGPEGWLLAADEAVARTRESTSLHT